MRDKALVAAFAEVEREAPPPFPCFGSHRMYGGFVCYDCGATTRWQPRDPGKREYGP